MRNFDYKEKPEVFEYYPQYYHKTDKVGIDVVISWDSRLTMIH